MNNLNSILLEGNLVRDPLVRITLKGTSFCTFPVASSRYYKEGGEMAQEVSFFDVEVWGGLVDLCMNKGHKGCGARVIGRLRQDRWQDADGKNRSRVIIVAEHLEFKPEHKAQEKEKG